MPTVHRGLKMDALPGLTRRPSTTTGAQVSDCPADLVAPLAALVAASKQDNGGTVAVAVLSAVEPSRRGALAAIVARRPALFGDAVIVACLLSAGKVPLANAMGALPAQATWRRYVRPGGV